DDYYGNKIEDPYRYMEDLQNSEVQAWFKGQNDYTRSVLGHISGRDALLKRIKELDESAAERVSDIRRLPGEQYFYQKRLASEDMSKIYTRTGLAGQERLLVDPVKLTPSGSPSHVINYYNPSLDGSYVAYDVSPDVKMVPTDVPFAFYSPAAPKYVFGIVNHGVQPELTGYVAPLPAPNSPVFRWRKLFDVEDGVVNIEAHGDDMFLITHKD